MAHLGRIPRGSLYVVIGAVAVVVGLAAASSLLFTQTFPSVPTAPAGSLTASCSTLQDWTGPIPYGGGLALFNCTGEPGAFEVTNPPATVAPTFTLPTNASDLYVLPAYPEYSYGWPATCDGFYGAIELTNGTAVELDTGGSWDYCIDATGGLAGFSISWSTAPGGTTGACPTSTAASIGSSNDTGPSVAADSVSVHSDAWAAGATNTVVTPPISVSPGSTLLVFVGFIAAYIGGPSNVTVCDSSGDSFVLETSTASFSSNHTQEMFLAFDVLGGSNVSFAAEFTDTDTSAGGVVSVVDLNSSVGLSLGNLVIGDNSGDSTSASVNLTATNTSFMIFTVTGQGNAGPYMPLGNETLLGTNGYYDTGPWTDGESVGTMVGTVSSGPVSPGANLAAGPYVWNAIAVLVT